MDARRHLPWAAIVLGTLAGIIGARAPLPPLFTACSFIVAGLGFVVVFHRGDLQ